MDQDFTNRPASSPCSLSSSDPEIRIPASASADQSLINSLSRSFGIHLGDDSSREQHFLADLARLFHKRTVEADTAMERHEHRWANVYLVQYGILRLFRESPTGRVAIHHFFTEGDTVWPVFGRTRTQRNTLCLSAVTPATIWVADFTAFRDAVRSRGEGAWANFALSLTEELAELTSMREFRKQTMPARERYRILLEEYPELVRRVPDNQLASWLGVVPATFSRLKK